MYRINIESSLGYLSKAKKALFVPSEIKIKQWVKTALRHKVRSGELTICLASKKMIRTLNKNYRHKDKPTNVLSFRADLPKHLKLKTRLLGDIIICAAIVNEEAKNQHKLPEAHWAHIIIHGVLHILGYDHEVKADAEVMEIKEIQLLKKMGFDNPY